MVRSRFEAVQEGGHVRGGAIGDVHGEVVVEGVPMGRRRQGAGEGKRDGHLGLEEH